MITRQQKRIIIIGIYLVIFLSIGTLIFFAVAPAPSCTDGKRNQREEKVDCGGPCATCPEMPNVAALAVTEQEVLFGGSGVYDVVASIANPNQEHGASTFSYAMILLNNSGEQIAERRGTTFILPSETKQIVETNIPASIAPSRVDVTVSDVRWEQFSGYEKPQLNIYNRQFAPISSGVGFAQVQGLLRNESSFDFNSVRIVVVLRNAAGVPVAAHKTEMRTVDAGEARDFRLIWPNSFPGDVQRLEMEAEADVYNSQNFVKKYLPGGKFQELAQ